MFRTLIILRGKIFFDQNQDQVLSQVEQPAGERFETEVCEEKVEGGVAGGGGRTQLLLHLLPCHSPPNPPPFILCLLSPCPLEGASVPWQLQKAQVSPHVLALLLCQCGQQRELKTRSDSSPTKVSPFQSCLSPIERSGSVLGFNLFCYLTLHSSAPGLVWPGQTHPLDARPPVEKKRTESSLEEKVLHVTSWSTHLPPFPPCISP